MATQQQTQAVATVPKFEVLYTPFQGEDPIKLTVGIIRDMIAIKTKSGKVPDENECIKFAMLCRSRKLNPFEGDCFLQGYDGKDGPQFSLITAHQAFLKRAEVHPEFDGFDSGVIVQTKDGLVDRIGDFTLEGDTLAGGWCTVFFKNRKVPMKKRLKLSTFNQGFGRWQKDAAGMIVKCAEADALRSSFPTQMGGMYLREEADEPTQDERFKSARPARAQVQVSASPSINPIATVVREPKSDGAGESESNGEVIEGHVEVVQPEAGKTSEKAANIAAKTKLEPSDNDGGAEASGPVVALRAKLEAKDIDERRFCEFASARYKLSPCSTLEQIEEIAPRKITMASQNFDTLIADMMAASN